METDVSVIFRDMVIDRSYFMSVWGAALLLAVIITFKPKMEEMGLYRNWMPWSAFAAVAVLPFFFGLLHGVITGTWFVLWAAPAIAMDLLMWATIAVVLGGGLWTALTMRRQQF